MVAVLHPTGPGSQIVIDRAVVLVGRSADCDVVINFSSKISRMHCVFVQVDTEYYIRDLGSMNGVRVNGQRVEKSAKLFQGAEVAIGDVIFQFHANVQLAPRLAIRTHGGAKGIPSLVDESVPIIDVEIIEDVEMVDDIAEVVEVLDEVEVIDIIDDVQILTNEIRRPRRPPRLR